MYDYDYVTTTGRANDMLGSITGVAVGLLVVFGIIALALVVFMIIAEVKMYKKAGKAGWEAIVPFYSTWVYVEIAGLNWWWFLVAIGGTILANVDSDLSGIGYLATLFGTFVCNFNIAKKFHKDTGFAVLMTIFPVVLIPMLAFGKSYEFDSSVAVTPNGPFDAKKEGAATVSETPKAEEKKEGTKFCPNCGGPVDGEKFCPSCGSKIDEEA